jgi:hypothetical protein
MRLAQAERERLWKGLERFVNCPDSLDEFQALGKAFPDFWPVEIHGQPLAVNALRQRLDPSPIVSGDLAWHPLCHELFLVYRDMLRALWSREPGSWLYGGFLLGIEASNERVVLEIKDSTSFKVGRGQELSLSDSLAWPLRSYPKLVRAWQQILARVSVTNVTSVPVYPRWPQSGFGVAPQNDFQRAFYYLHLESWRARVCPRCRMFFVARRGKQVFCGTSCSAGSRLASKRKWWKRVGTKRRASQRQTIPRRNRTERKRK